MVSTLLNRQDRPADAVPQKRPAEARVVVRRACPSAVDDGLQQGLLVFVFGKAAGIEREEQGAVPGALDQGASLLHVLLLAGGREPGGHLRVVDREDSLLRIGLHQVGWEIVLGGLQPVPRDHYRPNTR